MSSSASQPLTTYNGTCHCGAISYRVTGAPIFSAYCHCTGCQRQCAAAFIHTVHFPANAFSWTHSEPYEDSMDLYTVPGIHWKRWRCKKCGTSVSSHRTAAPDKVSVWGAQLERDDHGKIKGWEQLKPTAHIYYDTRMLDINDELGKWDGYENESRRIM